MGSRTSLLGLAFMCVSACSRPFPVRVGEVLTYAKCETPISPGVPGYDQTLQIRWLGTACHFIQLGDAAILTDPYFSHYSPTRVVFGTVPSDADAVHRMTSDLPRPQAIFIGHEHYDHLLDLAETLRQRNWQGTPIYGGPTTPNIVAGYGESIEHDCRIPEVRSDWVEIDGPRLAYRAFPARHAPHFAGMVLFPGRLTDPRSTPPTRARDFPLGEPFTYLFRLRGSQQSEFTVFVADAATDATIGIPDDLPRGVDVAILCVPSWKNVEDYPAEVIRRLRPRVILLSHLDNFLQNGWEKRELVASSHLPEFLAKARSACDYPEFERLVITDMGSTVRVARSLE